MSFDDLSSENIMLYATKAYDKPNCIMSEFKEDMKRFNYLKRLFYRHRKIGEIKERLVLNHLVVLYNVFDKTLYKKCLFYWITNICVLKTPPNKIWSRLQDVTSCEILSKKKG